MLLGVDVGGTFTDAVLVVDGVVTAKAPTTPDDQSEGVHGGRRARAGARRRGGRARSRRFAHGMTVATNALLEGRGARTALVATEGFTDVVELGRQARARPLPAVRRAPGAARAAGAARRGARAHGPDGVLRRARTARARWPTRWRGAEPEAVAVVLLHAYRHPEHERALGDGAARAPARRPRLALARGRRHVPRVRARGDDRGRRRALPAARRLPAPPAGARRATPGLPAPRDHAVQRRAGRRRRTRARPRRADRAQRPGRRRGGGGAARPRAAGEPDLLCFDMGGTSCDVCVVEGGRVRETAGREVGGRPLALPMVDIHTVGAGGGSIAWRDAGGALRVGPALGGRRARARRATAAAAPSRR